MADLTPCLPECVVESIETTTGPLYTWRVSCTRCRQQLDAGQVQGSRDQQFVDRAARARAASIASRRRGEWHARLLREGSECSVARELRQRREGAGAAATGGDVDTPEGADSTADTGVPAASPAPSSISRAARRDDDDRRPMRGRGPVIFAGGVLPRRSLRPWELAGEPSRSPGGAATPTNGADA